MALTKATSTEPKKLTATGKVADAGSELFAITLSASGANATVVIDNSEDGTGTEVWKLSAAQNTSESIGFSHPVSMSSGIYATISGSGAEVSVAYK